MKRQLLLITTTLLSFLGFSQVSPDFSPNHDVSLCGPNDVFFVCTAPSNPDNIWWDFGDGSTGTGINPVHRYTTTGMYTVKMIVQKGGVKDSITKVDFVTVNPKPRALFSVDHPQNPKPYHRNMCFVGNADAAHVVSFVWNINNHIVSGTKMVSYNFGTNGSYPVSLVVANDRGCTDEYWDTVVVEDEPVHHTAVNTFESIKGLTVSVLPDQSLLVSRDMAGEEVHLNIIDMTGRIIQRSNLNAAELSIRVSTESMPQGAYIIELRSHQKILAKRFDKRTL